jgi:hypothetical protein
MNRLSSLTIAAIIMALFIGCSPTLEVDIDILQEKIYEPTETKYYALEQSVILYLDHSTCVVDARRNSRVFNALRPQLGQYSDTLCLIKGSELEKIPLDRSDNKVFQILETINEDIPYSDILRAVEQICYGNQQAVLITDCEFIKDGLSHDSDPYLSMSFKKWLQKGHVIYIVTESYQENNKGKIFDKKRFYFFFTDDSMRAPISDNMLSELEPMQGDGLFTVFKMTNSDLFMQRPNDMIPEDLTFTVEEKINYEYVEIDDSWDVIREYVMKLDEHGELLLNDDGTGKATPVPLIKNLVFNDGENYVITDIEVFATNITAQYVALEDETVEPSIISIPGSFEVDKSTLKQNKLNVMVTEKIFNYINNEFGGNLIRLDFVITRAGLKPYSSDMFTWQSLYNNDKAICVSKSIDNVLQDVDVRPTSRDRRVIHTVFLKTQSY